MFPNSNATIVEVNALVSFSDIISSIRPVMIFPVLTISLLILFFVYYISISRPKPGTTQWIDMKVSRPRLSFFSVRYPMQKKDIIPLVIITGLFAFLALFKLGDTEAPQSFAQFNKEQQEIYIALEKPEEIESVMYYTGLWTGNYQLGFSEDGINWHEQTPADRTLPLMDQVHAMNQPFAHLFHWRYAKLNKDNPPVKYISISTLYDPIELGELAIFNTSGELVTPSVSLNPESLELFDEQHLVPAYPTYMNSMYFDEIFHGRTALEHLRNIKPYEITHPPLGKLIIASAISVFGMTPFGWRFSGAIFGVLMLIVIYLFIKNMFGKTPVAVCGTLLFGFDFMRFVQTRIATIDTYGVFFILLACYFMYRYITTDTEARFRKSLLPLALSGISFGLGCASKWIVIYAGLGLAVVYIIRLVQLYLYYANNNKPGYGLYLLKTLLFSVLFFVLVPAVIYCMSYIPYGLAAGMSIKDGMLWSPNFYEIIWKNQTFMFKYHSVDVLDSVHSYSAQWWKWVLNARPMLYYYSLRDGMLSSFAAFGNPVVWWGGIAAMIAMGFRTIKFRDGKALFILIGFLSQLLPWLPITRVLFIYHYFPSTIFIVLALSHTFNIILDSGRDWNKQAVYCYTAVAGLLFVMFYPALTGIPVPEQYYANLLSWFPGAWPF